MSFASFVAPCLLNALGISSTKIPVDRSTFISHVLPPIVGYFAVALLAVMPRTHHFRVALSPFVALLALRAALSVDLALGMAEHKFFDSDFLLFMFLISVRTVGWTFTKEPLVRWLRPANASPSTIMDALDLALNLRGYGWEWPHRLHIARETRPTNRIAFVLYAALSAVVHGLIGGAFHRTVLVLAPIRAGSSIHTGSTLFDDTLCPPARYIRAGLLTACVALSFYGILQQTYDVCTLIGVLVLGQDPAQWPPGFDAPWRATSLADFWGRRWHQWLRDTFVIAGGRPLAHILGVRTGIVLGSFLASAMWHYVTLVAFDSETDVWRMIVGFGMMAAGILAERAFRQATGRRVGGVLGWVWTMSWLVLWGSMIAEGLTRAGMFEYSNFIDRTWASMDRLVIGFDTWLWR